MAIFDDEVQQQKTPIFVPETDVGGYKDEQIADLVNQATLAKQYLVGEDIDVRAANDKFSTTLRTAGLTPIREELTQIHNNLNAQVTRDLVQADLQQGGHNIQTILGLRDKELEAGKFALESAAIKELIHQMRKDPVVEQSDIPIDTPEYTMAYKNQIITNTLNELNAEQNFDKAEHPFTHALNVAAMLIPFNYTTMTTEGVKDGIFAGSAIYREMEEIMKLPADEFKPALQNLVQRWRDQSAVFYGENLPMVISALQQWQQYDSGSKLVDNVFSILDVAAIAPGAGAISKVSQAIRGLPGTALNQIRALGANKVVAPMVKDALESQTANAVVKNPEEALRASIPFTHPSDIPDGLFDNVSTLYQKERLQQNFINDALDQLGGSISKNAPPSVYADQLERNREVLKSILTDEFGAATRFSKDEIEAQLTSVANRLKTEFESDTLIHSSTYQVNPTTLDLEIAVQLGNKKGDLFISKNAANNYAKEIYKFKPDSYEVLKTPAGTYTILRKQAVSSDVVIQPYAEEAFAHTDPVRTLFDRFIGQPLGAIPEFSSRLGTLARQRETKTFSQVRNVIESAFNKLNSQERVTVANLANIGLQQEKWLSFDEIVAYTRSSLNRAPTSRELFAYETYKELSDLDYMLRNRSLYLTKKARGWETAVLTNVPNWNEEVAKRVTRFDQFDGHVYDPLTKQHKTLTPAQFDEIKETHQILRVEDVKRIDGEPAAFLVLPNENVLMEPLSELQLAYKAGGRRIYEGTFFVKQRRLGVRSDGTKYELRPLTHIVAKTPAQANKFIESWNEALDAYKRYERGELSAREASNSIAKTNKYQTVDEFKAAIDEGYIDKDSKFELFDDRQARPFEEGVANYTGDMLGVEERVYTQGQAFTSRRGEHLKDPFGEYAPVVDPFQALQLSLSRSGRDYAFQNFIQTEPERWFKTYRKYLDGVRPGMSPYEALLSPDVRLTDNMPIGMRNNAIQLQNYLKSVLRARTAGQIAKEKFTVHAAAWVEQQNIPGRGKLAEMLIDSRQAAPLEFFRGLTYDTILGTFNPAQLIVQSSSVIAASAIAPTRAPAAIKNAALMRLAMLRNRADDVAHVAKRGKTLKDKDIVTDFKEAIDDFKQTALHEVDGNFSLLDVDVAKSALNNTLEGGVFKTVQGVREAGRVFVNEGERFNRYVGYFLARGEAIEKGILKPGMTGQAKKEALDWITSKALGKYYIGQHASNRAWYQRGLLAVPTQFFQFQFKLLGAMTPRMLGGSAEYTAAEKARVALGQLLFWGTAGVPGVGLLSDGAYKLLKRTGVLDDDMTFEDYKLQTRGVVDQIISAVFATETNISGRVGIGEFFDQFIKDLFNAGAKSPMEMIGGASLGKAYKVVDAVSFALKQSQVLTNPTWIGIKEGGLHILKETFSTVGLIDRSLELYNKGRILDKHGILIKGGLPPQAAILNALGFAPFEMGHYYDSIAENRAYNERVNKEASAGRIFLRKALELSASRQYEQSEEYLNAYSNLLSSLPIQRQVDVGKKVIAGLKVDEEYQQLVNRMALIFKSERSKENG